MGEGKREKENEKEEGKGDGRGEEGGKEGEGGGEEECRLTGSNSNWGLVAWHFIKCK